MFPQSVFSLLAVALSANALALPQENQDTGYLSFPLVGRDSISNYDAPLIGPEKTPFYIPVSVGTPPVYFNAEIDTGSYDSFVPNYNYNESSTVEYDFEGKGWGRPVSWIHDKLEFGSGPSITVGYGVYQDQKPNSGGVGIIGSQFGGQFPSYYQELKIQNYTSSASFSFWYDTTYNAQRTNASAVQQNGRALFGAYDVAKYQGPLVTIALSDPSDTYWYVANDGIVTPDGKTHIASDVVLLDTGNYNINLPVEALQELSASLNGSTWETDGQYISYPTCNFSDDQKLVFKFKEAEININLRDISYVYNGHCALLLKVGDAAFGAPFVANSFSVFDIDNKTVSFADRKFTAETDVQLWKSRDLS